MSKRRSLLEMLADGRVYSGVTLAKSLGVSRMAVWKQVQVLKSYGLDIVTLKRKGYQLAKPLELLESELIKLYTDDSARSQISALEIPLKTASTNRYLMDKLPHENIHGYIVVAEFQSAGKGSRDDRAWISPLGAGIYLSLGWHFDTYPNSFTALSLSAGVAVARALSRCGIGGLELKWPNDIVSGGKKLGGILIESRGITKGHCDIVVGIGINVCLPAHVHGMIDQPYSDLSSLVSCLPSRNQVVGALISESFDMLGKFSIRGFSQFIEEWRKLDHFAGKSAQLVLSGRTLSGRVLGIEENGMLLMSINGKKKLFASGELSLRSIN